MPDDAETEELSKSMFAGGLAWMVYPHIMWGFHFCFESRYLFVWPLLWHVKVPGSGIEEATQAPAVTMPGTLPTAPQGNSYKIFVICFLQKF